MISDPNVFEGEPWPMEPNIDCKHAVDVDISELNAYLARKGLRGDLDVMEIFGGMVGASKVCIRRRLNTGINVDLVAGYDLTKVDQREEIMKYIDKRNPFLITTGPP